MYIVHILTIMTHENFNSDDRKNKRRKNISNKPTKNFHDDELYGMNKTNKQFKKKKKEDLEEEIWEDWDRYYNH